jgi:hypothetical protein
MGFPRLGAACYTQTAQEYTQSKLNDMRHAWYVVSQCRPLDCGRHRGILYLRVSEEFEEALSVVIASQRPSVSSKQSESSFKSPASRAPACLPLTFNP